MTLKSHLVLLVASCLFTGVPAFANVTYSYTSNALEPWTANDIGQTYSPINISLDFSNDGTNLIDWAASQDEIGTITKSDTLGLMYGLTPHLYLTTNSTGQVTSWYISVYTSYDTDGSSGAYKQSVLSYSDQILGQPVYTGSPTAWDHVALISPPPERNFVFISHLLRNPGTWSSNGSIPNLNYQSASPVPESETYSMLIVGTALIGIASRRRSNKGKSSVGGAVPR